MISGYFNGFHDAHLDYLKQASEYGGYLICVVASDKQVIMKKGKVSITGEQRWEIVDLILKGLDYHHITIRNWCDTETPTITKFLECYKPDILFRGYDKTLETMPVSEREVCEKYGIEIIHAKNRIGERHSSEIM